LLGSSSVPRKLLKTIMKHQMTQLGLCCLSIVILRLLALAWNGIVQIDYSDNVNLCWLPGLGVIQTKSWLLKSHLAHAWCVKFLKVRWWGIELFAHSINQETSILSLTCRSTIILMLCIL
jgi:hypothetical protein